MEDFFEAEFFPHRDGACAPATATAVHEVGFVTVKLCDLFFEIG